MENLNSDRIKNIIEMENTLNEALKHINIASNAIAELNKLSGKIYELNSYYGSEQWHQDKKDSENGILPQNLKCGVLSEDAVWNMLEEYKSLTLNRFN